LADDAPLLLDVTRLIWRRWVGRHPTGIDRVCLAYLEHYRDQAQAVIQHRRLRRILNREASQTLFRLLAEPAPNFRSNLVKAALRSGLAPGCSGARRIYLNVGHTGLDDQGFKAWVQTADVRPVYLVHDVIPITHPAYCREGESVRHSDRMRTVLQTGIGVIGNSQATLDELTKFARREGLPARRAIVAWLGTASLPPAPQAFENRPTFVVLGTIEARKNHLLLLQVWGDMLKELGNRSPRLLVLGQRGWKADQAIALLESRTLSDAVVEIRDCDDFSLARHLKSACALLFPSLVEGYGMPLAEALQAGVPVIASDLPVFREIGQGVPEFLDPQDADRWKRAVLDYSIPGSMARSSQLRRMKNFTPPTWQDHFAKVDAWLSMS
jgi:glycosyltransferase involved in cell wall biosynthesis